MAFTIPNFTASATHQSQSWADNTDLSVFALADMQYGIISGCAVSAQSSPNMTVKTTAGVVLKTGAEQTVWAFAALTVAAATTHERRDIVVTGPKVVLTASYLHATGAVTSIAVHALTVALPVGAKLAMTTAAHQNVRVSTAASVGATTVHITSATPTVSWNATTTAAGPTNYCRSAWVVKGTACPTTAKWKVTNHNLPPVKPSIPATTYILAEVTVTHTLTVVTSAEIVDKRATLANVATKTTTAVQAYSGPVQAPAFLPVTGNIGAFGAHQLNLRPQGYITGTTEVVITTACQVKPKGTPTSIVYHAGFVTTTCVKILTPHTISSGTAWRPTNNRDTEITFGVTLAGTLTMSYAPTSAGTAHVLFTSLAVVAGTVITKRIPASWYVKVTLTTATVTTAKQQTL